MTAPKRPVSEQVASARQKFNCPACGAEANWNPAKQALICPFCGTASPAELKTRGRRHRDRRARSGGRRFAAFPTRRAAGRRRRSRSGVRAARRFRSSTPSRSASAASSAARPRSFPTNRSRKPFRPESLLPLKISESQARDLIAPGTAGSGWRRTAFRRQALTDTVKGIYLPYWTFDARPTPRGRPRRASTTTTGRRQARCARCSWTPASGALSHFFDDDLVCASVGVRRRARCGASSRFPPTRWCLRSRLPRRAGPSSATRSISSRPPSARASRWTSTLREMCAAQVPGDTYRNLTVHATFTDQTFKHILAPIWLLTIPYGAKSFQVVVNGVTGIFPVRGRGAGSKCRWSCWRHRNLFLLFVYLRQLFIAGRAAPSWRRRSSTRPSRNARTSNRGSVSTRRSARRAGDHLDAALPQLLQLLGRQRMDEVFEQEVDLNVISRPWSRAQRRY